MFVFGFGCLRVWGEKRAYLIHRRFDLVEEVIGEEDIALWVLDVVGNLEIWFCLEERIDDHVLDRFRCIPCMSACAQEQRRKTHWSCDYRSVCGERTGYKTVRKFGLRP